jgi:hypothetical protein
VRQRANADLISIETATSKAYGLGLRMVPQTGLEPVTPSLRMTCSTN